MANFCGVMVSKPADWTKKRARKTPDPFPPSGESSGPLAVAAGTSAVDFRRGPPFRSDGLELVGGHLARALVGDQLKADLLTFAQIVHSRAFDGADMNEGVLAAVVGLDEAEALLRVKPLHCANRHDDPFRMRAFSRGANNRRRNQVSIFRGSSSERANISTRSKSRPAEFR